MNDSYAIYSSEKTCIKVYDPSTQKVIGVFSTIRKAADKMCLTEKTLRGKLRTKQRVYSKYYDKDVAVRHSAIKEGDNVLIEKTLKNIVL
jgi:hypothetical protein